MKIAQEYAAKDVRVKIVRNPHLGIVATRNSGLAATDKRSEFITFFDSDDLWEKNAAATLIAALEANPKAPAAHGVCRCVDMNGIQFSHDNRADQVRNRRAVVGDKIVPIPRSAPTSFEALLVENYITTPGTSMIRRWALDVVGNFDAGTEPVDDWDINLRVARLGGFVFVDEILLSWRRHSMAVSNVSKRLRTAYLVGLGRSIDAPENTEAQRKAARTALRYEILSLQKKAVADLLRAGFMSAHRKFARSLLLSFIYVGVRVPERRPEPRS
jgi:glycosyltransferase involved in cell wall biosynthesis